MNRAVGFIGAALLVGGSGCGDNFEPPHLSRDQLSEKLRKLPGVKVEERSLEPKGDPYLEDAFYYILYFTQPIDHCELHPDTPCTPGTFQQRVALLHRNERAPSPMVIYTSGYALGYDANKPIELTRYFSANQASIEHRFYGTSRPEPADWTRLTVEQMAADEHTIIETLHSIYGGAFLTTGGSKGGMTAIFHRWLYPEDQVDGTVGYVAPLSFGTPDDRYPPFFATVGPAPCRNAVRSLAVTFLERRSAMETAAKNQGDYDYSRIAVGPAVESAITGFEWAFWQYWGADECQYLPDPKTSSDDTLFDYLDHISPVKDCSDQRLGDLQAYYYQSYAQLGYPEYSPSYFAGKLQFEEADYAGELPTAEPEYDDRAANDVLAWATQHGRRLLLIYGEWDPWIEGRFVLGDAEDSEAFVQPGGTHHAMIASLKPDERDTALVMLQNWTHVSPNVQAVAWQNASSNRFERRIGGAAATRDEDPLPPRVPPLRVHPHAPSP